MGGWYPLGPKDPLLVVMRLGRASRDTAKLGARTLYLPTVTSIFLAEAFCSVFSPTEMVRMPSR
jgi:hypothetical protein